MPHDVHVSLNLPVWCWKSSLYTDGKSKIPQQIDECSFGLTHIHYRYKVRRVVIGENKTFVGGEAYLKQRGVEVVVLESEECKTLMKQFIEAKPTVWWVYFCY